MTKPTPRINTTLREIEYQLRPFLTIEAADIIGRMMARLIARDSNQFQQLTDQFKRSFNSEHEYLSTRHASGGPDTYHRTGVS